jgi:hypothetical protein
MLDFQLTEHQVACVLREALDLAANHAKYSFRELAGTLLSLRRPYLRARENLLSRQSSMYCSAFVQYLFRKIGLDLSPGVDFKNTTPEDIARTPVPHMMYLLKRDFETMSRFKRRAVRLRFRAQSKT